MKRIVETKTCDVLVCGAGIAGVAAALEAARAGVDTLLVEKTAFPGGLATTGLVNIYLPLCDGNGTQVSFGLAEELLLRSLHYGPGRIPEDWRTLRNATEPKRYRTAFSPASYILSLDEALEESGVRILFDALACIPLLEGDRICGAEIENKSGRLRIQARCVVDATGDADMAFRAGAPCVQGSNRLSLWAIEEHCDVPEASGTTRGHEHGPAMTRLDSGAPRSYSGTDGDEVSSFLLESRKLLRERCRERYARDASLREAFYPVTLPAMAQYRTTRRIAGEVTLHPGEDWQHRPDSVGLIADWRAPGSVWEVPYGTLLPRSCTGLLAAGRCMASADDAWQVMRVIPAAAVTGQACGRAAALSVLQDTVPSELPVATLQHALAQRGIPLHLNELYGAETIQAASAR